MSNLTQQVSSSQVFIKAKELAARNRVNMVIREGVTLYYPIQRVKQVDGKIVVEMHNTEFEFDPEQVLQVQPTSLFRDQKRKIFGMDVIRRFSDSRNGNKVVRKYRPTVPEGHELDSKGILELERDPKLKLFKVVNWPEWLPTLDAEYRHAFEFQKSWKGAENLISAITGAVVSSIEGEVENIPEVEKKEQ